MAGSPMNPAFFLVNPILLCYHRPMGQTTWKGVQSRNGSSMRAVEIKRAGFAEVIQTEVPSPGPKDLLVKVHATGICRSDLAAYVGKHPYRIPPLVTGHEVAGVVTSIGKEVNDFLPGDPVVIEPHIGCGHCVFCNEGDYNLCRVKRVLGTRDWSGSFAEYIAIPRSCAYRIPSDLPMDVAALVEPLSVGIHAVAKVPLQEGKTIAILGSGTIGLTILLGVLQTRPRRVICTDIRDTNLKVALSLGANDAINPHQTELSYEILRITGNLGVDTSFIVADTDEVVAQALQITRPKGTVVVVALFEGPSQVDLRDIQMGERQMVGTLMYTRKDYRAAMDMLPSVKDSLAKLITHHTNLKHLPAMLENLSKGRLMDVIKVIVEPV